MTESNKPDPARKDDPMETALSSDYAQGEPVGRYAGGGPGTSQEPAPKPKGEQTWQAAGEKGGAMRDDPNALHQVAGGDGAVRSRSADPGQSSYGGFTNEGGADATHDALGAPRDAGGGEPAGGGMATSNANLGDSLPPGASGTPDGSDRDDDASEPRPGGVTGARTIDAEGASEATESPTRRGADR